MKTTKSLGKLQNDYFYQRDFILDLEGRTLKIMKNHLGVAKESYDLNKVTWVDTTKTQHLWKGYRYLTKNEKVPLMFSDSLSGIKSFVHPLAVHFEDCDMVLLWFKTEEERNHIGSILISIE